MRGQALNELRERAGLSLDRLAAESGHYRRGSSIHRYFGPDFDNKPIPMRVIAKLGPALLGKGDPPISMQELAALTDLPEFFQHTEYDRLRVFETVADLFRSLNDAGLTNFSENRLIAIAMIVAERADPKSDSDQTSIKDNLVKIAVRD